jgi:hypothetical protein
MKGYLVTAVLDGDTFDWIEKNNEYANEVTNIIWIKSLVDVDYDPESGEFEFIKRVEQV